ncbi:MAG: hypothetical protein K2J46_11440, partial [Muribaculaceae bacterium]|nr:hypothetical protein [Muribaculaceae bacterium]
NITYRGNQIYHVAEGAPAVTQNGSMDFPGGAITSLQFTYNEFGALTADPSRGITDITYDNWGNPTKIQFESGLYITNVYSATGEKLETISCTLPQQMPVVPYSSELGLQTAVPSNEKNVSTNYAFTTTEYHGPLIYRHGSLYMVLFPGGYATIKGTSVTFYYYTQDYLGNNRAVINGSTGAIEQTVAYYPYGGVIADIGTNQTAGQPYKFGGKELITANGLNEYDFGARQYYSAVPGFTKPDQHCEKYYWLSPYLYCANNPVNLVDPTGKDSWTLDEMGNIMNYTVTDKYDEIIAINRKNDDVHVWKGEYGSIKQKSDNKSKNESILTFSIGDDETGLSVFEFLADNSAVEWSVLHTGLKEDNIENVVTTSHQKKSEAGATAYIVDNIFEIDIRSAIHSHPSGIEYPSGLDWDSENPGDVQFAGWVDRVNKKTQATYKIYNPLKKTYIEYNSESTHFDFLNKK